MSEHYDYDDDWWSIHYYQVNNLGIMMQTMICVLWPMKLSGHNDKDNYPIIVNIIIICTPLSRQCFGHWAFLSRKWSSWHDDRNIELDTLETAIFRKTNSSMSNKYQLCHISLLWCKIYVKSLYLQVIKGRDSLYL